MPDDLPYELDVKHDNALLSTIERSVQSSAIPVELHAGDLLLLSNTSVSHVYFPAGAVVCWVGHSRDGHRVQLAMVGREGMAGATTLWSDMTLPWNVEVQLGGMAYRVALGALKRAFENSAHARQALLAHGAYLLAQTGQASMCIAAHSAENRLARWLLTLHSMVELEHMPLGQECLAEMIGVRRPTLSLVANKLQRAGILRLARGRVAIVDHEALTRVACECHQVTRSHLDRYMNVLRMAAV